MPTERRSGKRSRGDTREKIYRYMRKRILLGQPPTVREVRDAVGLKAVQAVQFHLEKLVESGRLVQQRGGERGRSRGYSLPDGAGLGRQRLIPLLGRVQAGELTTAFEDPDGYLTVQSKRDDEELFSLRVHGKSMVDAAILPADLVVVRRQDSADDGDIVVAMVGDEATVKVLRLCDGRVELHPANAAFKPIVPSPDELLILGKVIEIRRHL